MRVRRDEKCALVRAWFIYLEVRRLSVMIPYIQIYLREVGLGFGYRFTIASIKVADRENDVKKLLASLTELSRTQADLARRDRWEIDLEDAWRRPALDDRAARPVLADLRLNHHPLQRKR